MNKAKAKNVNKGVTVQLLVIMLVLLLGGITVMGQHFLKLRSQQLQAAVALPDLDTNLGVQVIYLVRLSVAGEVALVPVSRRVEASETLVDELMRQLVQAGAVEGEELRSFLPVGTQFLGAEQAGDRLYLNFNEAFRFNPLGYQAYIAQLKQVVYTATQSISVQEVVILIEGQEVDFLNDGVFIGEPLTRASWGDEHIF